MTIGKPVFTKTVAVISVAKNDNKDSNNNDNVNEDNYNEDNDMEDQLLNHFCVSWTADQGMVGMV